ncbi:hypothetical protein BU26DRAFT_520312 [Trematosphaeria pertusa]|uniref:Spt20-like SEP domain-containing protein n=1 Tax=Trematosphaeria pertusa TaxID=390896 RepID=A0A6A6IC13_9PLEO|nr:uncharacterized protein BU26DRAFT_520312 [Trematosphaeria pertusa]KAF2247033.1 hypothetical protein BU26DRAFT_520312 [Trematosphaeria pertusa]
MSAAVATVRPSQALRQRRESQRPSVAKSSARQNNMENGAPKEDARRFVYTQQDVLAKFKGQPPSLRVSLHQNHFRLNDSQETLSYASPMRELLQHIRDKTVPHNMLEDFYALGIQFYDNCLIVEVQDYRSGGIKPKDDANNPADGNGATPFSIHNYNNFITPSPHVPYPTSKSATRPGQADGQSKGPEVKADKDVDKENMPAPGQSASQKQPAKAKVTTVVLFPTPQSHYTDLQLLATTPMPDANTFRRNQAAGRIPGNPPTPLSAVPPTPTLPGRSPKRQKMVLDDNNIHQFEAEVYNATCPKLYLEPTKSLEESVALIQAMTHPNNQNSPPARKTRKRTTAELAADEAEAADIQRFMLAGDEYQASKTATATGGDDAQHAARAGANSQTFSRFKTLATIKMNHEEAERRKKEEEARLVQAKRQAQLESEVQKRREMEASRQAEQNAALLAQRQEMMRQQQQQQQQALQQEQAMRAASQAQQLGNVGTQVSQTPHSATQPQFSSPVVRQNTPMAASPLVSAHASHPMGGTPMVATSSNQGAGSPARPPSSISHHPTAMMRSASQQQNQSMSRTGTPQIVQGTPVMNTAMPARNMASTPTPRMNQGSPSGPMQGSTPIMMSTPQPGPGMTPDQMQQMQQQQSQIQQMRLRQQMQQQGMSPGNQQQAQQLAMHRAKLHIQQNGIPQGQNPQAYQQMLAQKYFASMQQQNQQAQMANQMSPQGIPHGGMPNAGGLNMANMNLQQLRARYMQQKQHLVQTYGQNIPQQAITNMRQLELAIAQREQQQQQMAQQGGQMHMNQGMQNQMGMQGGPNPQNPVQMQQYQAMLQQQRARQQQQQQMMAMRQQAMQNGGQIPQGMMNNMQGLNMNMGNMGNMGMNMNMQNMNVGNMGMQGMQGMNMGGQMNQQQIQQQMMMMRQAQQRAAMQQGQGGDGMNWSGV